jgi:hypothetical protein
VGEPFESTGSDSDENHRSWLVQKLLSKDVGAAEPRVRHVDRFCELYTRHGLFDGDHALPLDCDCPAADECWAGVPAPHHPPRDQATVSVPWIGPGYRRGGVAALGINFHDYGGLGAQWWIRRGSNDRLRQGKRKLFDYRAGSYLALAHASLDGEALEEAPDPRRVADAWDRSAFLEAVKCAPHKGVSEPTDAMRRNCPARYLVDELPLLEPGVLVVVGRWVGDALAELVAVERTEQRPGLWRGAGALGGRGVEILCCNHPSYGTGSQLSPRSGRRSTSVHWSSEAELSVNASARRLAALSGPRAGMGDPRAVNVPIV